MTTLITYGQAIVAQWCGVKPVTITMWIDRYDNWPQPDSVTHTSATSITRGWLPERKAEWLEFATMRAESPGARLVAMRKDR
jgi:uncharacterized protein YjcR